jgi:hypothetical protein
MVFGLGRSDFKDNTGHLLVLWNWVNYFNSLSICAQNLAYDSPYFKGGCKAEVNVEIK